jgi:hypothetical protein
MRRDAIIFCAAVLLALPTISNAQYNDNDQQNPKEYHDEDSQALALVSYLFYPIGYAFEWAVARPLHYITSESPVAPVFRPVGGDDQTPPPPVPIIPDNTLNSAAAEPSAPQDWTPTRAQNPQPAFGVAQPAFGVAQPSSPARSSAAPAPANQPTLH